MNYLMPYSSHFQALNSKCNVVGFQELNSQPCLPNNIIIVILGSPMFPIQMLFADMRTSPQAVLREPFPLSYSYLRTMYHI